MRLRSAFVLVGGLAAAAAFSLVAGGWDGLFDSTLLWELRLPRLLTSLSVGAGLAVSGLVLQTLFGNPLCEPYTLGVSSGAALGGAIGATLGGGVGLTAGGLLGGGTLGSVLSLLATRSSLRREGLLLAGVMFSFFGSSLIAVWMALVDPRTFRGVTYWLMGDVSRTERMESAWFLVCVGVLGAGVFLRARVLDAFLTGDDYAASLGIAVPARRAELVLLASALTAACVCESGMIGFVGLVAPHFARRWFGSLHRGLIPAVAALGAAFVASADALGRALVPAREIPVGAETALLGAPLFAWILIRQKQT